MGGIIGSGLYTWFIFEILTLPQGKLVLLIVPNMREPKQNPNQNHSPLIEEASSGEYQGC